jgi:VanZ family protein
MVSHVTMSDARHTGYPGIQIALLAALLIATVLVQSPDGPVFLHVMQKLGHPVVFGICSLLILALRHRPSEPQVGLTLADCTWAFGILVACGVATEIAQGFAHRDPCVTDVLRDALGAATALAARFYFAAEVPDPRGRYRRMGAALVCILGLATASAPMAWCLAAYANRDLHSAVLWQFQSALDLYFAEARSCELRDFGALAGTHSNRDSLCVALPTSEGSAGFVLSEPYPDWRGRSMLMIDLNNPMPQALHLTVRVNDRDHNQENQDRFNRSFVIPADMRRVIAIPLTQIAAAPRGRRMDMQHIAHMAVFRSGGSGDAALVLRRIWLQ